MKNSLINDLLPPLAIRFLKRLMNRRVVESTFEGDFPNWAAALKACGTAGYAEQNILDKTHKSAFAVKNGEAVYEKDSVLYDEIRYSWPLLSALLLAAAKSDDRLKVLDFGGAQGCTFFQNRKFLEKIGKPVDYGIVEQPHYVDLGNKNIANAEITFFKSSDDYKNKLGIPDAVILSGVLQYLEKPYITLKNILSLKAKVVCVDRTSFLTSAENEKIMIQNVSDIIYYAARYPCHFFKKSTFLLHFEMLGYQVLESFDALDDGSNDFANWEGFIFLQKHGR